MSKRPREETKNEDQEEPVDLLALLNANQRQTVQMKDLPPKNKKGKVNYYGYMDQYFGGKPPVPVSNVVFDNDNLQIIKDLTGEV